MKTSPSPRFLVALLFLASSAYVWALGQVRYVEFTAAPDHFPLVQDTASAGVYVDSADWPGVVRVANDLHADITRVTGVSPAITHDGDRPGATVVIVGTLGRSALVDRLVREGKLDVTPIAGKWESFIIQTLDAPLPGIARALVIAGSDKRGTIYGAYDLSEQIGVSPWYWWADVPSEHRDALFVKPGRYVQGPPSVKYRGIFLNDEAPDLTNWIAAKFGSAPRGTNPPIPAGIANYGHEFYTRIFEVLLRMKANYLWPAMWNNAFNEDDPANPRLADEYGIVMGTSHQEPMLRAQKEWDRRYQSTLGSWNYAKHPEVLQNFWREGVRRNRAYESIVTMGLRGANDTEMAPGGPAANRALLEQIVDVQRGILRDEVNSDVTRVPQLWCLYKEVQDYYADGMRAPDDVTLLWAEDNWGNVRRLPTAEERTRSGGAGVYYHFDYHGGPRSYQWLNTSPLPKIWDQMALAKQYGADRIWIVNVGHFKGYELPMEYFLSLAWNTDRWTNENLTEFTQAWAAREFGPGHASEIADILARYPKYNGRRKPELLAPATYSLVNYREAETVVADYDAIAAKAEEIFNSLPAAKRDAFYQLVLFPTKACAIVNQLYVAAGKNALYAQQGRASTADFAGETRRLFDADIALMNYFNGDFADGRWAHFMDQTHLGYTTWRDPPTNNLAAIPLVEPAVPAAAALGVAVEGSTLAWPGATGEPRLPQFDRFNRPQRTLEVFNRGGAPFAFTATASEPWIVLSQTSGTIEKDLRLAVTLDWARVPSGATSGTIRIAGAGGEVSVRVDAFNPTEVTRETLQGFVEADGYVSIEPEHFSKNAAAGDRRWIKIEDYGRTLSAMRATAPVDAVAATPGRDAPCLEYRLYLFTTGAIGVTAVTAPTLNFMPDRPLRYAVSFDDQPPEVVTLVPAGYNAQNGNADWERSVSDNARFGRSSHTVASAGYHTLKIWMIDPGVVVQKLVVDLGGVRPSYLGPPESYWIPPPPTVAVAPRSHAVAAGDSVTLSVTPEGVGPFAYQWQKTGVDVPGATNASLTLHNFQAADAGSYRVVVSNAGGSTPSPEAVLKLGQSWLTAISVRGGAGTGDQTLIMGFALNGTGTKSVLLRNVGPMLAAFGVSGVLADPELLLFRDSTLLAENDDWAPGGLASATLFTRLGLSPLTEGAKDSALLASLAPGSYTVHSRGKNGGHGIALLEAYETDSETATSRFSALSVRNQVGRGDDVLIVGFVVAGDSPKKVLLRGLGPALAASGLGDFLANPQLAVYDEHGLIAKVDDWDAAGPLPNLFTQVGLSGLSAGSHDAALSLSLDPGVYTAQVSGVGDATGVALFEVYALP